MCYCKLRLQYNHCYLQIVLLKNMTYWPHKCNICTLGFFCKFCYVHRWKIVVHKRMFYIRTNLQMLQHSNVNTMQQNDVFW